MNIYSDIAYDHNKITKLIYDIEALGRKKSQLRAPLFNKLKKEILILHRAEEETLYKRVKTAPQTRPLVQKLKSENEQIEDLLSYLSHMPQNTDKWHIYFAELKKIVFTHIQEEEARLLPKTSHLLDPRAENKLEQDLRRAKEEQWDNKTRVAAPPLANIFVEKVRIEKGPLTSGGYGPSARNKARPAKRKAVS